MIKEFLTHFIIAIFILISGEVLYAQTVPKLDFKASGFLDTITFLARNIDFDYATSAGGIYGPPSTDYRPGGGAFNQNISYLTSRARLKFDAEMDKSLSGTIFFEMDSSRWGETGDGRNRMGAWSGDRVALEIKNVYMEFATPFNLMQKPATIRVGLQPLSIRPAMVVYTDGMGITGTLQADPITLHLFWFKGVENQDFSSDDVDVYGLNMSANLWKWTVGYYELYYKMNTYPFPTTVSPIVNYNSDIFWLGVYADGKIRTVDFEFDFVYDIGLVKDQRNVAFRAGDIKYRGWATRLKADYSYEKFHFAIALLYASGADQKKTDPMGLPGNLTPYGTKTTKVESHVAPPGSESYLYLEESLIFYGSWVNRAIRGFMTSNTNALHRSAIGGTWFAKLSGSYRMAPWYKIIFDTLYIGDTTKNGNTIGNAKRGGLPRDDHTIGIELDLIHEISVYKNLKWNIGLGYLFAGKAFEYFNAATGRNEEGKDPWVVTTRLIYTF